MGDLYGVVAAAAGAFVGTNVDDLVVLTVLFLSARAAGVLRPWRIWVGQYAGITVLVAVSAVAALGLTLVPDRWVGLLGLVPILLGLKGLLAARRARNDEESRSTTLGTGLLPVAGVTVANGVDNISVYTPMFRTIGLTHSLITIGVFAAGVGLWCLTATWLSSHRRTIDIVQRFGHWIVPGVFIVIGTIIVLESGVLPRLIGR